MGSYLDGDVIDLVSMWTDPTNGNTFNGEAAPAVNPTKVGVHYRINGGAWQWAQYGFSAMVKDAVGTFHLALDGTGMGGDTIDYVYRSQGAYQKTGVMMTLTIGTASDPTPTWS